MTDQPQIAVSEVCSVPACNGACGRPYVAPAEPQIVAPPTPLERAESFARSFRGWANELAMLYGGPLYLVGSALTIDHPGDYDLRLQLDRETCVLYWGDKFGEQSWDPSDGWFARKREELKQSRRITKTFGRGWKRFDFQFQCTLFRDDGTPLMREGKPVLRLDECPTHLFAAGRGDP